MTLVVAAGLAGTDAFAASVVVAVADRDGRPVSDAVVMLEPMSGHLPIRPMTGVEIAQAHRQFDPRVTVVTVGTSISFPNRDTVRHHVYSFSAAKTFELKLYAGVPATPITFDKPGVAVLGCNIHDDMVAWVVVVDTPLYARSSTSGKAQVDVVPDGRYQVRVWHPELPDPAASVSLPVSVEGTNVEIRAFLATLGTRK